MQYETVGVAVAWLAGVGIALFLLWRVLYAFDRARMRREAERSRRMGIGGVCRYGVNAEGQLTRIHVRRCED